MVSFNTVQAASIIDRVRGKILLQVQQHGEAWYVNPADGKRYYMKDGNAAYQIMRQLGLGITDNDLGQIPISTVSGGLLTYTNNQYGFQLQYSDKYQALTDSTNLYGWPHAIVLIDERGGSQSYSMQVEAWDLRNGYENAYNNRQANGGVFFSTKSEKYISINYYLEGGSHDSNMEEIIRSFRITN